MLRLGLFKRPWIAAALSALCTVSCGPPGSGQAFQEAGLSQSVLAFDNGHSIRTVQAKTPETPKALVIFIHGTPGSADAWTDTLAQTPTDLAALAYDRLGYGETEPNDAVTSLEEHAQTVKNITDAVLERMGDPDLPVILAGHSYGGPVAAKAAAIAPERYKAVVMVAAALDPGLEKVHWAQRLAQYQPIKFLIGSTLRNANAELIALEQELVDLKGAIRDTPVPVYVLHGGEDELVPVANVDFMKQTYPSDVMCKVVLLPEQNHFLPWNEISALWALIRDAVDGPNVAC